MYFQSAELMARSHTLSNMLLLHHLQDLDLATRVLNDYVYRSSSADRYSTFFCGVLNSARTELTYVNAGHIPPFIVRKNGSIERPEEGDLPIGLMPGVQ